MYTWESPAPSRVSSNRRSASFRSPVASCNFKRKSSFVELLSANERSNVFTHLFASQTSSSRELARAVAVRRSPASFAVSLCAAWRLTMNKRKCQSCMAKQSAGFGK